MSRATSARYAWGCPKCGAKAFDPCRSLTTERVTDTHMARLQWPHRGAVGDTGEATK